MLYTTEQTDASREDNDWLLEPQVRPTILSLEYYPKPRSQRLRLSLRLRLRLRLSLGLSRSLSLGLSRSLSLSRSLRVL